MSLALVAGVVLAVALGQSGRGLAAATAAASAAGGTTPSGIVIICSPDNSDSNETCNATVGGGDGSQVPTGTVDFTADPGSGSSFPNGASCVLTADSSNATATCSVLEAPAEPAGTTLMIAAAYLGDATFAPSTGTPTAAITSGGYATNGWTPSDGTEGGESGTSTLPEFNLINMSEGSSSDSITSMNMSTGVYSGNAEVSGEQFADNGVLNGNFAVQQLTEGGYVSTDAQQFFLLPNDDLAVAGRFYAGTYASDQGQVPGRIGATGSVVCAANGNSTDICTETVTGSNGTPTGNATFSDANGGAFSPSNACVLSGGVCSVSYTPAAGGNSSGVSAIYSGDPTYIWTQAASAGGGTTTSTTGTTSTTKYTSGTQVVCNDVMPGQAGDYDQCTATVGGNDTANPSIAPTGSVSFTVNPGGSGGFLYGSTCTLTPSQSGNTAYCSVDYSPPAAAETEPAITATYSGDTNFLASSGSPQLGGAPPDTGTDTTTTPTDTTATTPSCSGSDSGSDRHAHACSLGVPVAQCAAIRGDGQVFVERADGSVQLLKEGDPLYIGDTLIPTGDVVTAVDFYLGGSGAVIPNTTVEVADERKTSASPVGNQTIATVLQKAAIWADISHQKGTMQVQTNDGVMGIKG